MKSGLESVKDERPSSGISRFTDLHQAFEVVGVIGFAIN
jgi:hypothetical protein